ncbi:MULTISPECIES: MarR family winged helix-turn-helix transcriptional regulator [Anaerococcus]|uniref:HTH-type transcriptional regulator SarZ n=1 Tax=Anaerococcus nagyae TaxID=1755241 RepID=A0A3E2TLB7_9FIRM|nr:MULTISPECIES: MarR family transcriptional regulator [Anaerococcus]MBP2070077.1 DNA-binding MarR family transcriptional regulator [Anaerococcus nagyae]MDU1828017.1 MarR family transcriptional regulator [Anaerococcus sp.]MDU1864560.1 MarR family transcriptional regulator [Anaerococcus sp.]MDU2353066.1 MarR family transcriptional regulator [Anaerococcus sp.]MDU2565078.1 MarR family transcriptional regulator [Anaerococcus sp.]
MATEHIDFFEFNNSIFSMIREISHKIDILLQDTATETGITTLQLKMLITLYASGDAQSIGNLGKAIGVTGGNISNICKKLEKQGFVDRLRSEEDERVVNVTLTEKGRKSAEKVGQYFDQIRTDIPTDGIDVNLQTIIDELGALDELLDNYISRSGL